MLRELTAEGGEGGERGDSGALDDRLGRLAVRWGEQHLRDLPWRRLRDPWAVLVVEVMAQQTQLERVIPRWTAFLDRWPSPDALADAALDELLVFWKGLGYPRRARNLWLASRVITQEGFPSTVGALQRLPGVGPYTAAAVASFAFESDVAVVDTNVGRVLARLAGRKLRPSEVRQLAHGLVAPGSGWIHNSAMIDIGSTICRPRSPLCESCPLMVCCAWSISGRADPDPAAGSAAVSRPQPRFEGSVRQLRGKVLGVLGVADHAESALVAALIDDGMTDAAERVPSALRGLAEDGLIEIVVETQTWQLARGGSRQGASVPDESDGSSTLPR